MFIPLFQIIIVVNRMNSEKPFFTLSKKIIILQKLSNKLQVVFLEEDHRISRYKSMIKLLFFLKKIVIILSVSFLFLLCSKQVSAIGETTDYDQKISGLSVTKSVDEDLTWNLVAEQAFLKGNGDSALLENIKLHYFLKQGDEVVMTSEKAAVEFSKNQIFLQGSIRANAKRGIMLETESLYWNGSQGSITTPDKVLIKRSDFEIRGQGLDADIDLERIKIKANAETIIY